MAKPSRHVAVCHRKVENLADDVPSLLADLWGSVAGYCKGYINEKENKTWPIPINIKHVEWKRIKLICFQST